MTLPAARDLAKHRIRVATIAPGMFHTAMVTQLPADVQEKLGRSVPFPNRLGHADEYASLALSIVENPMLNGATLRLDGAHRSPP
jgi:NAD(P)-dependent dehydrogenase (short-subunit alcohol dehydrogenase family)